MITDPIILAALDADVKRLVVMSHIAWPTGDVFVHSRIGEKRFNSNTWIGIGEMGKISGLDSGAQISRFNLEFNSPDIVLLNEASKNDAIGSEVKLYLGAMDQNRRIVAAQLIAFKVVVEVNVLPGKIHGVSIACGGPRERYKTAKENNRFSAAAWRARYPDDSYCDDVEALAKGPLSSYSGVNAVGTGVGRISQHSVGDQKQP